MRFFNDPDEAFMNRAALLLPLLVAPKTYAPERASGAAPLQLVEFTSDTASYHVLSLIHI